MDDGEMRLRLLERAETARTNQNSVVWTTVSIFAAAQAVLAQAVAQAATTNPPHVRAAFFLSLTGLGIAGFGTMLIDRGLRLLNFQERVQRNIENALRISRWRRLSNGENNKLYRKVMGEHSWRAKVLLRCFCGASVLAWLVASGCLAFQCFRVATATAVTIILFFASASATGCITTLAWTAFHPRR